MKRTLLITLIIILVSAGGVYFLRTLIAGQLEAIQMLQEDTTAASRVAEVAVEIDKALKGRDDILSELDALLPKLIDVSDTADEIEDTIKPYFVNDLQLRTGGVSAVTGATDETIQGVQFTVSGRIRKDDFDKILEEFRTLPVLVDISSATLDLKVVPASSEGQATYLGTIFARTE